MQMRCNMIPREPGQSSFWWRTNMLKATMYINWPLWLKQAIYCICLLSRDDQLESPELDFDYISPQIGQSGLWLWSLRFQITPHFHEDKWSVFFYKLLPEECSVIMARMKKMSFNFQMETCCVLEEHSNRGALTLFRDALHFLIGYVGFAAQTFITPGKHKSDIEYDIYSCLISALNAFPSICNNIKYQRNF